MMRLRRLGLTRYGRFTDQALDFGERSEGVPDLHVVYGPNEAGKSTAVSAYLDLLFGIERSSRYGFLHPYDAMRIDATLEVGGVAHALTRVKKPQRSLLDGIGQPTSEALLPAALGGLDRAGYQAMFSLDDATLESGGDSILASRGEVGELLFEASAGVARLSEALAALRKEADEFRKANAHGTDLRRLKEDVTRLRDERAAIDMGAVAHERLTKDRDAAAAGEQAAIAARAELRLRLRAVERRRDALPVLARHLAAKARLAALAGLADVPAGWMEELDRLRAEEARLGEREVACQAELARARAALAGITSDPDACAQAARWETLGSQRDRHVKARNDLPGLRDELAAAEARIGEALARLGRAGESDPARLLIDAPKRAALLGLIAARPAMEQASRSAETEHADALMRLGTARSAADAAGGGHDTAGLAAAMAAVRGSDHAMRARDAARRAADERDRLAARRAGLAPWSGDDVALAGLAMPDPGRLAWWRAGLADTAAECAQAGREVMALDTEIARLAAERAAIGAATGAVTDAEAAVLRAAREAAWTAHRGRLDAGSADDFEAALRRDDAAVGGMLRHARQVARLHELGVSLAQRVAERDAAAGRLAGVEARRAGLVLELSAAARGLGLPEDSSAELLEAWTGLRGEALRALEALRQAERDAAHAAEDEVAARARLSDGLAAAAVPHDPRAGFVTLLAQAESALDKAKDARRLHERVADCTRDLAQRRHALQRAGEEDRRWRAAWAEACAATWLAEGGAAPDWTAARALLDALPPLEAALEARTDRTRRIGDIAAELAAYGVAVAAVAGALGLHGADGLELAGRVSARVSAAVSALAEEKKARQALDDAQARAGELAQAQAAHAARRTEMTAHFAAGNLAEVGQRMAEATERDRLLVQAEEAGREMMALLGTESVAAVEAALAAVDRDALEREAEALAPQAEAHDREVADQRVRLREAQDKLDRVGSRDDAARLDAARRVTLLEIEEGARRHLRLLAGIAAAERALHAYRERHRSAMMERASAAFRVISRGAYSGLAAQPAKDGEVLVALGAPTGAKLAPELSKGTRFQLYLALRVAGYRHFAETRAPVPFLADDIMETFDDDRSEEAFRLLGEMATVGQVIYLTHHRHLCETAMRVVPGVRVHGLG